MQVSNLITRKMTHPYHSHFQKPTKPNIQVANNKLNLKKHKLKSTMHHEEYMIIVK